MLKIIDFSADLVLKLINFDIFYLHSPLLRALISEWKEKIVYYLLFLVILD